MARTLSNEETEREQKRARGRPARLSRESILEAGLALLERSPDEPLTLTRVANEVDAVPAALYRHVGSHDELLDGVLALVLEGIHVEIRARASWPNQVRDWMTCVRAQLLRYPAVVRIIGRRGRTSPAWLDATSVLIEILERAGLSGAKLAQAYIWVTETTMGCVQTEANLSFPEQIEAAQAVMPELSDEVRGRFAALGRHLESLDEDAFFSLIVDRTVAGVVDLVGDSTPRRSAR
jgi:AcrR family transcriptional regulator